MKFSSLRMAQRENKNPAMCGVFILWKKGIYAFFFFAATFFFGAAFFATFLTAFFATFFTAFFFATAILERKLGLIIVCFDLKASQS